MDFPGPCNPCTIQAVIGVSEWQCKHCDTVLVTKENWSKEFQEQFAAHVTKILEEKSDD